MNLLEKNNKFNLSNAYEFLVDAVDVRVRVRELMRLEGCLVDAVDEN